MAAHESRNDICIVAPFKRNVQGAIALIYRDILKEVGYKTIEVDCMPWMRFKLLLDLIRFRDKYKTIHVHSSGFLGDIRLLWVYCAAKLFHKTYIITYHCGNPDKALKYLHPIVNRFFNSARLITVPSDYSKNILLKYNPKISNKLVKFPNLLDPSKFSSIYSDLRRNNSKNIVLTVANIKRSNIDRKGLKYFIRAAKLLPDIDFYVVGGFYDNSIKLLRNLSPQNVYFTGAVYGDELLRMYNRADVYCQLSKSESFGMALAESMLCECVPIVSNKGALPEVVGDSGFFVKESAPEEISENILKALDSKSGKKARDQILDNFSITKKKDDLIKLFLQFGVTP